MTLTFTRTYARASSGPAVRAQSWLDIYKNLPPPPPAAAGAAPAAPPKAELLTPAVAREGLLVAAVRRDVPPGEGSRKVLLTHYLAKQLPGPCYEVTLKGEPAAVEQHRTAVLDSLASFDF